MIENTREYFINVVAPKIKKGKTLYLIGTSALEYTGLSNLGVYYLDVYSDFPSNDGIIVDGIVSYWYSDSVDTENYIDHYEGCVAVPTRERALAENMKANLRYVDEGTFLEALYKIVNYHPDYNYDLLLKVSNHFGVTKETLDYWISEADDYMNY